MDIISKIIMRFSSDLIGKNQYRNKYYRKKRSDKRFVIFNGRVEASKILPMWHGWLHKITGTFHLKRKKIYEWQKDHLPNLTGTSFAVKPNGILLEKDLGKNRQLITNHGYLENNYEI